MRSRRAALPVTVLVGLTLVACGTQPSPTGASATNEPRHPQQLGVPGHPSTRLDEDQRSGQAAKARVASDVERLADRFTAYAVGDAASFPHWESVSMAIGGENVKSIDDIGAAMSNRDLESMPA